MLISVCIPTFNGERYIRKAIASVLNQSYRHFEIVVSDHSSQDETLKIVQSFADCRIRIVQQPRHASVAENWNFCVANSKGQLIKVMGQDDVLYPDALAIELEAINRGAHSVGFCFSDRDVINASGRLIRRRKLRMRGDYSAVELIRLIVRSGGNPVGEPLAVLFRRDVWQETDGFRGSYCTDIDFYTQILAKYSATSTGQCIGAFRIHSASWGSTLLVHQFGIVSFYLRLRAEQPKVLRFQDIVLGTSKALARIPLRILIQHLFAGK